MSTKTTAATYPAVIGARVIEMGSAKGRGTIAALRTTVGIDMAAVQWDDGTLGVTDWVPVRNLTVMSGRPSIDPKLGAALVALQTRVHTARAALDEATRRCDTLDRHGDPQERAAARTDRHRAWSRLTEAQECLAVVERCR